MLLARNSGKVSIITGAAIGMGEQTLATYGTIDFLVYTAGINLARGAPQVRSPTRRQLHPPRSQGHCVVGETVR